MACAIALWRSLKGFYWLYLILGGVTAQFQTREDCDSVLGDWKRLEDSKYLYPSDWNKWKYVNVDNGQDNAKDICASYGLMMPSAYHIKDWLSLQEIGRIYFKKGGDKSPLKYPFYLGDKIYDDYITDSSGSVEETFILWAKGEPSGDGNHVVLYMDDELMALANDRNVQNTYSFAKVVCMYPKGSFCFNESTENIQMRKDKLLSGPMYLGRVLKSYYLWFNFNLRFPNETTIDKDCRRSAEGEIMPPPPETEWFNDMSVIEDDPDEVLVFSEVMNEVKTLLESIGIESRPIFGTDQGGSKTLLWNDSQRKFEVRTHAYHSVQYFSLCIYRIPEPEMCWPLNHLT